MRHFAAPLGSLLGIALVAPLAAAEPAPLVTRILERIPATPQELGDAHDKSELGCIELPENAPLAQRNFNERVNYDLRKGRGVRPGPQNLLFQAGRWPVIDYGTGMTEGDRKALPFFTSSLILDVIDNTYVTIQARVHRLAPDGEPYLHYVPIAGVGEYGKLDGMTAFSALQQLAVSNVRGLGLFVKSGQPRNAQSLRTLVVSIKGNRLVANNGSDEIKSVPTLELLLVRMRVDTVAPGASLADGVKLYAFGTTDGLTRLLCFKPYATPKNADDCTIRSTVCITEYSLAGQMPSARAAREVRVRSDRQFTIQALDAYAGRAGLPGNAFENMTEILDAIIDGKLQ
jgi:hypothetical protein